jgi:hypothetical protein
VCPKLPIKLITDPAVGGALHAIALKVFDIRRARSIKAIEWQNPGKRQEVRQQQLLRSGHSSTHGVIGSCCSTCVHVLSGSGGDCALSVAAIALVAMPARHVSAGLLASFAGLLP